MTEVSFLSQNLCSPREGLLNDVYKVFSCLQNNLSNNPGRMAFDTAFVYTYKKLFKGSTRDLDYWKYFYPDSVEDHPRKNFEPLGEPVTVQVYLDANHAWNLSNRKSH